MNKTRDLKIAIDGPSASGKSSAAQLLAEKINYARIEGGLFYRAVTFLVLEKYGKPVDEVADGFNNFIESIVITVKNGRIMHGERDLTEYLRTPTIDANVGFVAKLPLVRKKVFEYETNTINTYQGGLIMD